MMLTRVEFYGIINIPIFAGMWRKITIIKLYFTKLCFKGVNITMRRILTLSLCALLVLGLVACGGSGGSANTLQNYLREQGAEIEEMFAPVAQAFGMDSDVEVEAEGNDTLVFRITVGDGLGSDLFGGLQESFELIFISFAEALREELDFSDLRVVVRYIDTDDNLLIEQTF